NCNRDARRLFSRSARFISAEAATRVAQVTARFRSDVFWRFSRRVSASMLLVLPMGIRSPAGSAGDRSLRQLLPWRAHLRPDRDDGGSYSLTDLRLKRPQAAS